MRLWWVQERGEFDWLSDDPEFQRLVSVMSDDLERQRARLRELVRNGELAPVT